ncbi:polymorphic toxin-type HINT domain-containing protein [Streptomyces sp. NPDC094448]|uniref:polymorphic toxin-type HINT domain-containing protein n=1 Tax=Streptomyces sp. NPDC094448 TaxID=3366063 RepID=UPI003818B685
MTTTRRRAWSTWVTCADPSGPKSADVGSGSGSTYDGDSVGGPSKEELYWASDQMNRSLGGRGAGSGKGCTGNSFTPGPQVLMADGTTKPIEEVENGDKAVATDPETGETAVGTVTAEINDEGTKKIVEVVIDTDGLKGTATATVTATDGHPFWGPELRKWIDATDLAAGSWLRTGADTLVQVTAVERHTARATVHSLMVSDLHTYYVLAVSTQILVHKSSCPRGKPTGSRALGGRIAGKPRGTWRPLAELPTGWV